MPDIVLLSDQTAGNVSSEASPLILKQVCPCSDNFEVGVLELKVLKSHRQLVLKVKEIGVGVTVSIVVFRNDVFLEEINLTNDSDLKVTFDLQKNDKLLFAYTYPDELLPSPKMNFELLIKKKHHC